MLDTSLIDNYINNSRTNVDSSSAVFRPVDLSPVNKKSEADKLAFLEMYTNMKEISEDVEAGGYLEEGQINGQDAFMKIASSYNNNGRQWKLFQEGTIGNKNLSLEMISNTDSGQKTYSFTGEYNNKPFDLKIDYPLEKNKLKAFWNEKICNRMHVPD